MNVLTNPTFICIKPTLISIKSTQHYKKAHNTKFITHSPPPTQQFSWTINIKLVVKTDTDATPLG